MQEKLIVGLDGDDSSLRKKFDKFAKYAQEKGKKLFSSDKKGDSGAGKPSSGQSSGAQKAQEAREKQRLENHFRKHSMVGYMHAGRSHISKNMEMGSDLDELKSGGFYNVFTRRLEGLKTTKDWIKDRFKDFRGNGGVPGSNNPASGIPGMPGAPTGGQNQSAQTVYLTAQTVYVRKGGMPGIPGVPGVPGQNPQENPPPPAGSGGDGGSGGRGGLWSALGKAVPFLGLPMAVAGGLMQLASAAGQRYASAIGKQTGTWNALGGYVGGGGGYFANQEVAQGTLAFGKTSGYNVYVDSASEDIEDDPKLSKKQNEARRKAIRSRGAVPTEFMQFASGQGEALSTIMQGVGTLSKQMGRLFGAADLESLRGYSAKAGFKNLRESEFFLGVSNYINQLRSQGFGTADPMQFASFAASLQGSRITEDRRLGLAQTLEDKGRKNILGGGLFGNLGLVEAMKETGGDVFAARRLMQANPGKYMQAAMQFLGKDKKSKEITAFLAEKEGIGPQIEMETLDINDKEPDKPEKLRDTKNPLLSSENLVDETYVRVGAKAFELSQKMVVDMANITKQLEPAITSVSNRLLQLEQGFAKVGEKLAEFTNVIAGLVTMDLEVIKAGLRKLIFGG
jgi:hypothetical protein